jgi:hypothetical protein
MNPLYYIESLKHPGNYLHYIGISRGGYGNYELRPGTEGAALWPLATANQLITLSGLPDLAPVKEEDVIQSISSAN